ncbi:MAG: penicillin-binding transpeptidase domain-containing protein [Myxococcaceae bacterium]
MATGSYSPVRAPGEAATRWVRLRVAMMGGLLLLGLGLALVRAVQLQVVQSAKLGLMATDQSSREMDVPARRGEILDRRGVSLASSVEVDSLWVDPSQLGDEARASVDLARVLHLDASELTQRLARAHRFAWVKRQVTPQELAAAQALGVPGLGVTKEPKRFYPQKDLAAQVLGVVGKDGQGLEGLELAFEDELSGTGSKVEGIRDARGRNVLLDSAPGTQAREGANVTLTLDRTLQYTAEKVLDRAVAESEALSGMVVALDPRTGELLALAHAPRFNPNTPGGVLPGVLRDRAALDVFEPGSTFKAFVAAGALEAQAVRPDESFFCENGAWEVGKHVIHDTHPHGWLTLPRILQVSSNIGMAKVAQKLGREGMVRNFRQFGFGERSGLALPGEGRGSVPYPRADVALATQAFGQGISATAVQVAAAFGALANGGVLMRPYIIARVTDPDGVVLLENQPTEVRRVVSEKVARLVVSMLEGVVEKEGTGSRAHMDEYRVAGKTGTAQKPDPLAGGYSERRIASFAGIVPAEDPRLVVLVVIDEPKTDIFGGLMAAPAFKEIAAAALPALGVAPSGKARLVARAPETPKTLPMTPPVQVKGGETLGETLTERLQPGAVAVPDVQGRVGREAVARLLSLALEPRLLGSGRVVAQSPAPGARVAKGARVTLEMSTAAGD